MVLIKQSIENIMEIELHKISEKVMDNRKLIQENHEKLHTKLDSKHDEMFHYISDLHQEL